MKADAVPLFLPFCDYERRIWDLPIWHYRTVIKFNVRRLRYLNAKCHQQTFTQKCSELVNRYQQSTQRRQTSLYHLGQELGGQAGARLANKLNLPASRDILLRLVRRHPEPLSEKVRVLGVDDWAFRKGRRYGTILMDLKARRVVDLLPDRNAETIKTWLQHQPQVEFVARARSKEYAPGIHMGAPTLFAIYVPLLFQKAPTKALTTLICLIWKRVIQSVVTMPIRCGGKLR